MRLFISQPMKDRTDEEIKDERRRITEEVSKYHADVEVIDSFFEEVPHFVRPLWFLGKSLELMSTADAAFFAPGWRRARGCRIEHDCAVEYGIEIISD